MTVVRRRTPASAPEPRRRAQRAGLAERFPVGRQVQVYETYHDRRYAGRLGRVAAVIEERDESYPRGRVGVTLVYDELVKKLFGGPAPDPVWFGPTHLDKP